MLEASSLPTLGTFAIDTCASQRLCSRSARCVSSLMPLCSESNRHHCQQFFQIRPADSFLFHSSSGPPVLFVRIQLFHFSFDSHVNPLFAVSLPLLELPLRGRFFHQAVTRPQFVDAEIAFTSCATVFVPWVGFFESLPDTSLARGILTIHQ